MSAFAVGSFVVHRTMPLLGIGKVFCAGYQYALVGFIDDHGQKEIRRLPNDFVIPAPDLGHPGFDGWSVEATSDCKEVPKALPGGRGNGRATRRAPVAEWTLEQAHARFMVRYPGGFDSDQYRKRERDWKLSQRDLFHELLPGGRLREFAVGDPTIAGQHLMRVVQARTPMLSPIGELPRLGWALRDGQPAPFLLALADVIDQPEPEQACFEALKDSLDSIPTRDPGARLLTWPILTLLPFLVLPDQHMFLKPKPTKEAARRLGVDLLYNPGPTWVGYKRLLDWSHELLDFLRPHGAKDLIDVQSFIWTIVAPQP